VIAIALALPVVSPIVSIGVAHAQDDVMVERQEQCSDEDIQAGGQRRKKKRLKTVKRADGVVVVQDVFVVCGKAPKPVALVVMGATTINYEWETAKPNFLKRVHESLKESAF
jgi:hypothetical protein